MVLLLDMVFIRPGQSTLKQEAYARRVWGAQGESKKDIALDVGYSENVADNPKAKIESTHGFAVAIADLAIKSNNVALKILNEFSTRNLANYSAKDLNAALNSISGAWEKFQPKEERVIGDKGNKLREALLNSIVVDVTPIPPDEF
jgi:hypothetical protein